MPYMYLAYRQNQAGVDDSEGEMSLPNRQMNSRRLPPLPGGNKRGNSPHVKYTGSNNSPNWQPQHPRSGLARPGSLSPKVSGSKIGTEDMMITGESVGRGGTVRVEFRVTSDRGVFVSQWPSELSVIFV